MKLLTTEEFILRAKSVQKAVYDYSRTNYVNAKQKVVIICEDHGEFIQSPYIHLSGCGCPKCGPKKISDSKRSSTEEFIKRAIERHGDEYDYSLVEYKTAVKKVIIVCEEHGKFKQTPFTHLGGAGCSKCGDKRTADSKRKTLETFITESSRRHDNRYDYSEVVYVNDSTKIKVRCPDHGIFEIGPGQHLVSGECPTCITDARRKKMNNKFLEKANKIHKYWYIYDDQYISDRTKMKITCPDHGPFIMKTATHLLGYGCEYCETDRKSRRGGRRKTTGEFIKAAKKVHPGLYNYSLVEYVNDTEKVKIICEKPGHGEFLQSPGTHLSGGGCQKCSRSHGETKVAITLDELFANYKDEYTFQDCRDKHILPFDFAIFLDGDKVEGIIEYHGEHHYMPVRRSYKHTEEQIQQKFENGKLHDSIKEGYCKQNKIPLLIIPYWEKKNIPTLVGNFLSGLKVGEQ